MQKVLVTDDNEMNLKMAEFALKKDFAVIKAKSGWECISALQEQKDIALLLLDIEMPLMDGFETLEKIRQHEDISDIPVLFLTADGDTDTVKRALEMGVVDYVKKPFNPANLLEHVKKILQIT